LKIKINIDDSFQEDEIIINIRRLTPELERAINALRLIEQQMSVIKNNEVFIIDVASIIYCESVDRKTFVYTSESCYETKFRLYEIEEQLFVSIRTVTIFYRKLTHKNILYGNILQICDFIFFILTINKKMI